MTRYNEIPGYTAITYYFQYNHRGDVLSMTDQWGTVVAKYTYDPWGNIISVRDGNNVDISTNPTHRGNINPIRYAGYRYDTETKLYYLLARHYDPSTYRFLTKDPDGGDKDRPLSQNPYGYGDGNPVMKVDPEGEYFTYTDSQGRKIPVDFRYKKQSMKIKRLALRQKKPPKKSYFHYGCVGRYLCPVLNIPTKISGPGAFTLCTKCYAKPCSNCTNSFFKGCAITKKK